MNGVGAGGGGFSETEAAVGHVTPSEISRECLAKPW